MDTDGFIVHVKKQMIFTKILQKMLKHDFIFQMYTQADYYPKQKIKK